MKKWAYGMGLVVAVLVVALLGGGCEKSVTEHSLEVTPDSAEVEVRGAVHLTASRSDADREIYYPLEWSVSDDSLGSIRDAAGDTAVYSAGVGAGVNTVVVRDQMGAEGMALITQVVPDAED